MRAKEFLNEDTSSISQNIDGGSLTGYVVDTNMVNMTNYLSGMNVPPNIINELKEKYNRIGIIKNVYIDDEMRGQGLGNSLMSEAIESAFLDDANAIILIADSGELNDFDLTSWYEGYGFVVIGEATSGHLMVLDPNES